jgi:hypothetical protein
MHAKLEDLLFTESDQSNPALVRRAQSLSCANISSCRYLSTKKIHMIFRTEGSHSNVSDLVFKQFKLATHSEDSGQENIQMIQLESESVGSTLMDFLTCKRHVKGNIESAEGLKVVKIREDIK